MTEETERSGRTEETDRNAPTRHIVEGGTSPREHRNAQREYMDRAPGETHLKRETHPDMAQYATLFSKYIVDQRQGDNQAREETEKKERARRANKIYREVCREVGIASQFFKNFIMWSDYINGKTSEEEFYAKTLEEAQRLRAQNS